MLLLLLDPHPLQNEEVCQQFNDLRSDMVLHYELKSLLTTCDMEIHSLKHQYEAIKPGETLEIPKELESISSGITVVEPKVEVITSEPIPPVGIGIVPSVSFGIMT